jgi:hypothetical protein
LKREQALKENILQKRPVDALQMLKQVFPALASLPWKYSSESVLNHIYDLVMETSKADLRAGVRVCGPIGDEERYIYGVRINIWSKHKYGFRILS